MRFRTDKDSGSRGLQLEDNYGNKLCLGVWQDGYLNLVVTGKNLELHTTSSGEVAVCFEMIADDVPEFIGKLTKEIIKMGTPK